MPSPGWGEVPRVCTARSLWGYFFCLYIQTNLYSISQSICPVNVNIYTTLTKHNTCSWLHSSKGALLEWKHLWTLLWTLQRSCRGAQTLLSHFCLCSWPFETWLLASGYSGESFRQKSNLHCTHTVYCASNYGLEDERREWEKVWMTMSPNYAMQKQGNLGIS